MYSVLKELITGECCAHGKHGNPHKKLVQVLIRYSRAELVIAVMDEVLRPLPNVLQAVLSTLFISVVPIFLIYGMNKAFMSNKELRERVTQYMIAFAVGGLLGDVFFHTLPHLTADGHGGQSHEAHVHENTQDHGHSHNQDAMNTNFIIVIGILSFFLIERMTHSILEESDGHDHHHGHSHGKKVSAEEAEKNKQLAEEKDKKNRLTSYAIIMMLGDFIHNFTDGLSIGVAYIANYQIGVTTTIAMLFHEIPHELGDFAILMQLDYSLWGILKVQFATSLGALFGTVIGAQLGQLYMKECLAFTSGGFLYFAINGLLGELKGIKSFVTLANCMTATLLGLYSMYLFALFE